MAKCFHNYWLLWHWTHNTNFPAGWSVGAETAVAWGMTRVSPLDMYQLFSLTCCLHLQHSRVVIYHEDKANCSSTLQLRTYQNTHCHIPKEKMLTFMVTTIRTHMRHWTLNQVIQRLHTCDFARSSFSFCASPSLCLRPNSSLCWSCSCAKKSARSSIRLRTWAWLPRCFLRSSLPITVSLSTWVESWEGQTIVWHTKISLH